jgi:hypothetical protein
MNTLKKQTLLLAAALVTFSGRGAHAEPVIVGEYFEAMNCDVGLGPARGESRGDHAIVVWAVNRGSWDGVELGNLTIVGFLDAEGRLKTDSEGKIRSVVIIDKQASEAQAKALLSMAVTLAPRYFEDIVRIEKKNISYKRVDEDTHLEIGDSAEVKIRTTVMPIHCESVCGNADKPHPSLSRLAHSRCSKIITTSNAATAGGLRQNNPDKQSALVGQFEL